MTETTTIPYNLEAEQGLLGLLLYDNAQIDAVADRLRPEHFYQPGHQRIYDALTKIFLRGEVANAVTLKGFFEQDDALSGVGGADYLFSLQTDTPLINDARDYARTVHELYVRRELIRIGGELSQNAGEQKIDVVARDVIEAAEAALFALSDSSAGQKEAQSIDQVSADTFRMIEMIQRGEMVGYPSGLTKLDAIVGGFMPGGLTVIGARPSMGKTALALTFGVNMAQMGVGVKMNSLEMPAAQLYMRLLARFTGIPIQAQSRRDMSQDYMRSLIEAEGRMRGLPFWIDDCAALTVNQIRTRARRIKRKYPNMGVLFIDYLGLIRATDERAQRVHQLGHITKALKAIAKTLDIHVFLLAQLGRSLESRDDKRPTLADLRDSGEIEEDADFVLFPYREEYYLSREEPHARKGESTEKFNDRVEEWEARLGRYKGRAEIIVAKNRNGALGTAHVGFGGRHQFFYDLARDQEPQYD